MFELDFDLSVIKYNKENLIPIVVQDFISGRVLSLVMSDKEALRKTIESEVVWSCQPDSGDIIENKTMTVKNIVYNQAENALLYKVVTEDSVSSQGSFSQFNQNVLKDEFNPMGINKMAILNELYEVLQDRKKNKPEGSYTVKLLESGIDRILKKVGEEAGEVIIAAKNADSEEIGWEIADLIYHMWMVLVFYDLSPAIVYDKLIERRK